MIQKENGFSLIEVLVSVVILSIVSIALISIFSQSLRSSHSSMDETTAANLTSYAASYLQRETLVKTSPLSFNYLKTQVGKSTFDICPASDTNVAICNQVFAPVVNGTQYRINLQVNSTTSNDPRLLNTTLTIKKDQSNDILFSLKGVLSNEQLNQEFPFDLSAR